MRNSSWRSVRQIPHVSCCLVMQRPTELCRARHSSIRIRVWRERDIGFVSSGMLELHHVDFGRPWYKRLAETVGLRYQGLACDPDPTSPRDMLVPVEVAADHVRNLLETPSDA
jgi:hypothetical protein